MMTPHFITEKRSDLQYYPAIDFLRGIGALIILVWHYHHFFFELPYFGPTNGNPIWNFERQPFYEFLKIPYHYGMWAVPFFWMLSGFVFAFVYLRKTVSAFDFFVLRFSRLYPLHLFSLLFIALLQYFSLYTLGNFQILEINDLYHFFLNLFYAQHWGFQEGYSFNSPSWSVSVEEIVYWAFWLVVIKLNVKKLSKMVFLCSLAFVFPLFGTIARAAFFFFGGIIVFQIHSRLSKKRDLAAILISLLLVLITATLIKFYTFLNSYFDIHWLHQHQIYDLFYFFVFALALFGFATLDANRILPEKYNSYCKIIGSLTYSTYMLHLPIQVLILIIFEHLALSRSIFDNELVFVVYIILNVVIGRVSYLYLERPAQRFLRTGISK